MMFLKISDDDEETMTSFINIDQIIGIHICITNDATKKYEILIETLDDYYSKGRFPFYDLALEETNKIIYELKKLSKKKDKNNASTTTI